MGNQVYWREDKKAFYEVWYVTVNHHPSGCSYWLRSTFLKTDPSRPDNTGGLWFARFDPNAPERTFHVHRYYPDDEVALNSDPFRVEIGSSSLSETRYRARFEQDGHEIEWDLSWKPNDFDVWLVPDLVRKSGVPKADVCVDHVDIRLNGTLTVDGERVEFQADPAGQSHHWGVHYAPEWLWGHCNDFREGEGVWFEALAVKLYRAGRLTQPVAMLQLQTPSGRYGVLSPADLLRSRADYDNHVWRFASCNLRHRVEAEFRACPEFFQTLPYISPHNEDYRCHNSCLCDLKIRVFRRGLFGWKPVEEWTSEKRAHAEFCTSRDTRPEHFDFKGFLPMMWKG